MSAHAAYTCGFCGTSSSGRDLSCPACASPVDVEKVVTASGWEELPAIPDLARIQIGQSTCQIEGAFAPVADFKLAGGDWLYFPHHMLLWMDPGIRVQVMTLSNAWSRTLLGMPVVMTVAAGPGRIAFSHDEPGEMIALPIQAGQSVDVSEHAMVAATGDVRYEFFTPTISWGTNSLAFGRAMDRFVASDRPGLVLVHGAGNVFLRRLGPHDTVLIHPSALLFKDSTVDMHQHFEYPAGAGVTGWNAYSWLRLYGPGRVAVRSAYPPVEPLPPPAANLSFMSTHRRVESSSAWYFLRDGQQQGPTSLDYIQGMALVKRISQDTLVWAEGFRDWVPASNVKLCPRCGVERPFIRTKYRPMGFSEWFWTIVLFVPCLPFVLLSFFMPILRCPVCNKVR